MATWPAIDGGRPAEAPVLLLPVALSRREGSNSYHLAATGGFQINLVLLGREMRVACGCEIGSLPH